MRVADRSVGLLAVLVVILALLSFGLIAWDVRDRGALTQWDAHISAGCHQLREEYPGAVEVLRWITDMGSARTMVAVAACVGVVLLPCRHWALILLWILLLIGEERINTAIKNAFERPRPPGQHGATGWSFPSSHAMGSAVGYGMLVYVAYRARRRFWRRVALFSLFMIMLVGCSRVYLGAHCPNDVLGGLAAGLAWLGLGIALAELVRGRVRPALGGRGPHPPMALMQ
jgi:undecaprenyl-diphosphatase